MLAKVDIKVYLNEKFLGSFPVYPEVVNEQYIIRSAQDFLPKNIDLFKTSCKVDKYKYVKFRLLE